MEGQTMNVITTMKCMLIMYAHLVLVVAIGPSLQQPLDCLCVPILSSFFQRSGLSLLHGKIGGGGGGRGVCEGQLTQRSNC